MDRGAGQFTEPCGCKELDTTEIMCTYACMCIYTYIYIGCAGLRCFAQALSSCSEQELLFIVELWLLTSAGSLVVEHGL